MAISITTSDDFLDNIEAKATKALENGSQYEDTVINPATVLLLLAELRKTRDLAKLNLEDDNLYQMGYKDGWADAKWSATEKDTPVAWAILVKGEKMVKIYSQPPKTLEPGMHCRPLYLKPQHCEA